MARARQVQPPSHALHTQAHDCTHASDTTRMHARTHTHALTHAPMHALTLHLPLSFSPTLSLSLQLSPSLVLSRLLSLSRSLALSESLSRTHGGTHPHVTRDPSIHSHHATPHTRTRNQACMRLNIPMHEYIIVLHYYYYLLFIIYSGCHAHARMYSFSADVHRIYEWGMRRATIAPCRPLHLVRLA